MSRPDQDSVLSDGVETPRRVPAFPRSRDSAIDRRLLLTATAAHFLNDFHVAFLAPLLPLVVVKFNPCRWHWRGCSPPCSRRRRRCHSRYSASSPIGWGNEFSSCPGPRS